MSIKVEGVSKLYGEQKALDNVSFEVKPGEIVGFLGPNGAGKSTMMKIITGFIPATSGKVEVVNKNIVEEALAIKNEIGYLAEQNPLYHEMYVREYLQFVCGVHKIKAIKENIDAIIETVGLTLEQNKKIGALSKGYKQRVGLAQALLHNPKVLILDEPTTGLDPNQLEEIRALIKNIGKQKTVMLSTHIMQEVEAICDRVIIINKGKIIANKPTSELGNLVKGKSAVIVEFDNVVTASKLQSIEGVISSKEIRKNTWELVSKDNIDIRNNIFQFAVKENIAVIAMQKSEAKLEDAFKQLTKEN